ncbi:hypothetical protein [Virgisporangium aurantiacum]|uniref:Uncharacterized protein n=1 Tax=Virgisporangium aurantiacum TaxID=175570 RepID=A0A8J3ZK26_9ACTN|nr:hypothetical protein [Virgisporangium aurantiacum]GIJ63405.1 hypothetical protein Vau01_109210 [Virgisporangium aurantiacum]
MTTNLEEHLAAGMRQEMRTVTLTDDVLGRARRRYRRRAAMVRLGYGLGVIGVAGALVAGLTLNGDSLNGGTAEKAPPIARADTPALRLANAATASDGVSYRIRFTSRGWAIEDGKRTGPGTPTVTEGAFDPRTTTGYARTVVEYGIFTELLINGTRYQGTEPRPDGKTPTGDHEPYSVYGQHPGTFDRLDWGLYQMPVLGATAADPTALLKALRDADATITENPDGTLHFKYINGESVYNGDITLDGNGRIAKVAIAGTWESTIKGRLDKSESEMTIEFSDYGLPVTAERPAKVVPFK